MQRRSSNAAPSLRYVSTGIPETFDLPNTSPIVIPSELIAQSSEKLQFGSTKREACSRSTNASDIAGHARLRQGDIDAEAVV